MPNDDAQVDAMIALLENYGIEKVGLIYTTDAYAGSLARTFYQKWVVEKSYTLSPSWDDSASNPVRFDLGTGAANAVSAINAIKNSGESTFIKNYCRQFFIWGSAAYNLISVGETNDVVALMTAANDAGLVGNGYVWGGFDVFASTVSADSPDVSKTFWLLQYFCAKFKQ